MIRNAAFVVLALLTAGEGVSQTTDTMLTRARALAEAGAWSQAADLYLRTVTTSAGDPTVIGEAIDALEACGRWREAIPLLDQYLAGNASDARRHLQRGLFGAWSGDREVGLSHLRRAVELAPRHAEAHAALAEVLSWRPADRAEAKSRVEEALRLEPANQRARIARANLTAWSGQPAAAIPEFDAVLRDAPDHVGALAGKAGALQQLGRHEEARLLYTAARRLSPADAHLQVRLAATELARGDLRAARRLLDGVSPGLSGEGRALRDSTTRGLRSSLRVGAEAVSRDRQLDRRGMQAELRLAVSDPVRLTVLASPLEFRDAAGVESGHEAGIGLRWAGRSAGAAFEVRRRDLGDPLDPQMLGGAALHWAPGRKVRFEASVSRSAVEETRRSLLGDGGERGAVHADLASASIVLEEIAGRVAVRADLLAGRIDGRGWESNERLGAAAEATVAVHGVGPHVRLGYAIKASRYAFNADTALASTSSRAAGYFSPRGYLMHQAVVQASHRFSHRLQWEIDGRVGQEMVRPSPGDTLDRRMAAVVNSRVTARLTSGLDLDLSYLYVDALDAFRMHRFQAGLRHYF